jgi:hypothetical protein
VKAGRVCVTLQVCPRVRVCPQVTGIQGGAKCAPLLVGQIRIAVGAKVLQVVSLPAPPFFLAPSSPIPHFERLEEELVPPLPRDRLDACSRTVATVTECKCSGTAFS